MDLSTIQDRSHSANRISSDRECRPCVCSLGGAELWQEDITITLHGQLAVGAARALAAAVENLAVTPTVIFVQEHKELATDPRMKAAGDDGGVFDMDAFEDARLLLCGFLGHGEQRLPAPSRSAA